MRYAWLLNDSCFTSWPPLLVVVFVKRQDRLSGKWNRNHSFIFVIEFGVVSLTQTNKSRVDNKWKHAFTCNVPDINHTAGHTVIHIQCDWTGTCRSEMSSSIQMTSNMYNSCVYRRLSSSLRLTHFKMREWKQTVHVRTHIYWRLRKKQDQILIFCLIVVSSEPQ